METLTTNNVLSLIEMNKAQRQNFAADIINKIENGEADTLKIHCQVKAMESLLKQFTDKKDAPETAERYAALVLDAAQKFGGKSFETFNGKFQVKEAGTVYDWTVCNDPEINHLLKEMEDLKLIIKSRQDFLKTVPATGLLITDESTGETSNVFPPAKSSTTIVSVSIK